jgi:hypothetical protein
MLGSSSRMSNRSWRGTERVANCTPQDLRPTGRRTCHPRDCIGVIRLILSHAAAVHGVPVKVEPVDLARVALKRLGLIDKGQERDRRPTQDELDRLITHFDANLIRSYRSAASSDSLLRRRCARPKFAPCAGRTSTAAPECCSSATAKIIDIRRETTSAFHSLPRMATTRGQL